jgi:2-polyprenyl-3-methyl-5-hydroxy-6-metoxy-1,4-benzoquinol methylase
VAAGRYCDEPLRGFIERDPWGECPLPYLQDSPWEYVACRDCQQAFHRFVLDDAWQARRFADWMGQAAMAEFARTHGLDAFDAQFGRSCSRIAHVLRLERMTRTDRPGERPRLLDFGCGFGEFVATAALSGFEACGVDWDTHRARGAVSGQARFYRDLAELEAQDPRPFQVVTLFEVLEHLVAPGELLQSLHRVMTPGGVLVAEVPDCTGVRGIQSPHDYACIHPLEHLNGFVPRSLVRLVERHGFEQVRPPAAWVTSEPLRVVKTAAKQVLQRWLRPTTQAYFRRR